jgi:multiple sugar transport system permease protein
MIREGRPRWELTALAALFSALWLFPFYWMLVSGLKTQGEIFLSPPTLWPAAPTLDAFRFVIVRENMPLYIWNSLVIATASTALSLLLATGAAWGMARIRGFWIEAALLAALLAQVFPPALMATPMFVLFRQIGLIDSQWAVILACMTKAAPFAIVMLRTVFIQIPVDLEDAARIDGCSRFSAFMRVTLPLAAPGIAVAGTLAFVLAYGEFVYASAFLTSKEKYPATIGLYSFVGAEQAEWHYIMSFATLFVLPVFLLFLLLQRRIVQGLTAGALK